MKSESDNTTQRAQRLTSIAPLLLILFCFFRYDQYRSTSLTNPATPVQICEQTESAVVDYHLPNLLPPALVSEDPRIAAADVVAADRFHRSDERLFSAKTHTRFRSRSSEGRIIAAIAGPCRLYYRITGRSDETPASISS